MWDLIVSVPDHCLSFYFKVFYSKTRFCNSAKPGFAFAIPGFTIAKSGFAIAKPEFFLLVAWF